MSSKIINSFNDISLIDFINSVDSYYIKDINIRLQHYSGSDQYLFIDVTDALKTGSVCNRYSITSNAPYNNLVVTNWIESKFNSDISKLVEHVKSLEFSKNIYGGFDEMFMGFSDNMVQISVFKTELKSINTYSPFNHAYIKPLTAIPAKWTMKHAVKAILNGQFDNLKCNGQYSDDFAYDAASNFKKGEVKNATEFIKEIIESPSGWWTLIENNNVQLCCHSFNSNSFTLNIEKQNNRNV